MQTAILVVLIAIWLKLFGIGRYLTVVCKNQVAQAQQLGKILSELRKGNK